MGKHTARNWGIVAGIAVTGGLTYYYLTTMPKPPPPPVNPVLTVNGYFGSVNFSVAAGVQINVASNGYTPLGQFSNFTNITGTPNDPSNSVFYSGNADSFGNVQTIVFGNSRTFVVGSIFYIGARDITTNKYSSLVKVTMIA